VKTLGLRPSKYQVFSKLPTLADDSGLFIDALAGKPGIYSSRWSGYEGNDPSRRDLLNIEKALTELVDIPVGKRGAQFKTVVAFYMPNYRWEFF